MLIKLRSIWQLIEITKAVTSRGQVSPIEEIKAIKLPIKRRYWLNKQLESVSKEITNLEQVSSDLIRRHGNRVEVNGDERFHIDIGTQAMTDFLNELTPLLEQEIHIPGDQCSPDDFGNAELSGNTVEAFDFLFFPITDTVEIPAAVESAEA